jgi:hypothetical protein
MAVDFAAKVQGLTNWTEVHALADFASQHHVILEIGSYLGKSTRALADNTDGVVVACDNFKGPKDIVITWKERQNIYERFVANMGEHITNRKVIPWVINHEEMTKAALCELLEGRRPDMCYIDGSHKEKDIARDIEFCMSVMDGGLLAGHDFQLGCPDVMKAVTERLGMVDVVAGTSIWWKKLD